MDKTTGIRWLRREQIIGRDGVTPEQAAENKRTKRRPTRPREAIEPLVPVSETTWETGVREGRFPSPKWIGRLRVWAAEDIEALLERIAADDPTLRVDPDAVRAQTAKARAAKAPSAAPEAPKPPRGRPRKQSAEVPPVETAA